MSAAPVDVDGMQSDLNDARTNWEAAAEELHQADALRDQLVAALRDARERMFGSSPSIKALIAKTDAALAAAAGGTPSAPPTKDEAVAAADVALKAAGLPTYSQLVLTVESMVVEHMG